METDNEIKVLAELPGVEKKDINLYATEKNLTISVETPQHKYRKQTELPTKIDTKSGSSTYKNGVLEVTLPKKKEEKPESKKINID
jgi:HSP20 family protein